MIDAKAAVNWTAEDQLAWERKVKEADQRHYQDTILAGKEASKVLKRAKAHDDVKKAIQTLQENDLDVFETLEEAVKLIDELQTELANLKAGNPA